MKLIFGDKKSCWYVDLNGSWCIYVPLFRGWGELQRHPKSGSKFWGFVHLSVWWTTGGCEPPKPSNSCRLGFVFWVISLRVDSMGLITIFQPPFGRMCQKPFPSIEEKQIQDSCRELNKGLISKTSRKLWTFRLWIGSIAPHHQDDMINVAVAGNPELNLHLLLLPRRRTSKV